MFKKLFLVAVVGGLAVAAFKNTKLGSVIKAEVKSMREAAEDRIAPEQEISRLRNEVRQLDDDTLKLVKQLARLQSDQADLAKRQKGLEDKRQALSETVRGREAAVRAAEAKAKAGEQNVSVELGDSRYSLDSGKIKLKDAVRDYTDAGRELTLVVAKLESQGRIVDKLEGQRKAMSRVKTDLELTIDALEAEYHALKVQQLESKYQTDDTRVAEIKASIAKLAKKFDVEKRTLLILQDGQAPAAPAVAESVDEIMAPLNAPKGKANGPTE